MIRTRFAPSPTGYLHLGGLRTCLYSYLYAKKHGGKNILRIEDTDQTRFVPGAAEALIQVLADLGIHFDEGPLPNPNRQAVAGKMYQLEQIGDKGPYIQSQRTELYRQYAQQLVDSGHAYYCFATSEELEAMRNEQIAAGLAPMYDRRALKLTSEEIAEKLAAGAPYVIRLKIPRDQVITFQDEVRGKVSFLGKEIDDQILIKSDGLPTYHLANVVDDHLMGITHCIRAEEWLPSTPKHLVMYAAFGWQPPVFAHLPLILNADKSKLSKRQNDVAVESYLAKGYCKEAIINYISLLGWHPGKGVEQEIFTLDQLISQFSLEHVNKAGAIFSLEKLDWFNWQWQKIKYYQEVDQLALSLQTDVHIEIQKSLEHHYQFTSDTAKNQFNEAKQNLLFAKTATYLAEEFLAQPRSILLKSLLVNEEKIIKKASDINSLIQYFFQPATFDEMLLVNNKMGIETTEQALENLTFARQILESLNESADLDNIKNHFLEAIKSAGHKNGQILWPLRAALTHQEFSVGAFESIWVLGKSESLKRLDEILKK